jgi:hypothetical protein
MTSLKHRSFVKFGGSRKSRGKSRGKGRGKSRDKSRGKSRSSSRGKSRGKSRSSSNSSRSSSRGKNRGKSRGKSRGSSNSSRGSSSNSSRGKSRSKSPEESKSNTPDKSGAEPCKRLPPPQQHLHCEFCKTAGEETRGFPMRDVFTDSETIIFCRPHIREAREEEVLRQTRHDRTQPDDSRLMIKNYIRWSRRRIANIMSHKHMRNISAAAKLTIEKMLKTFYGGGMRNPPNWDSIRRGAAKPYCPFVDKGNNSREDIIKLCNVLEKQFGLD